MKLLYSHQKKKKQKKKRKNLWKKQKKKKKKKFPGKDFSSHPHVRKKESFFWPMVIIFYASNYCNYLNATY